MNLKKTGNIIKTLRTNNNMTQAQLADKLFVSDKAVSKWERGMGLPDISLITKIAEVFGVTTEVILYGELSKNETLGGNMKKLNFFVCPVCGNIITSTITANITCCGKKLEPLTIKKADNNEKLNVEIIENDYYITSEHPALKEHYISFIAFLNGDTVIIKKQYPEWNISARIPRMSHGKLVWYCTEHGAFEQLI